MVKSSRPVEHSLFGNVKTEIHPKSKASEEHHGSANGKLLIGRVMVKIDVQKHIVAILSIHDLEKQIHFLFRFMTHPQGISFCI